MSRFFWIVLGAALAPALPAWSQAVPAQFPNSLRLRVDSTSPYSATEDGYTTARAGNPFGDLGCVLMDPNGVPYTASSGSGGGSSDTELPAAAALADTTANPTVPGVGAFGLIWNGATWDRLPGTAANGVTVNVGKINGVAPSMGNGVSGTGVQRVTIASDSTGIVGVTNAALSVTGNGTASGAQRVSLASDSTGQVALAAGTANAGYALCGHTGTKSREITIANGDGAQTNASMVGTINTGTCVEVYGIAAATNSTTDVGLRVGFGASAVPTAALAGVDGVLFSHPGIAKNSGMVGGIGCSLLGTGASGEEVRMTTSAATASSTTMGIILVYRTISC